jgi:hypothetical protein
MTPAEELEELFTTPPEEFVARRDAAARAWRKDGRRDEAAAVAGLRRPSLGQWALDVVARRRPALVAAFVDAVAAVEQAGAGSPLRERLDAVRLAENALLAAATEVLGDRRTRAGGSKADLLALLREIAVSSELRQALSDGRLHGGSATEDDTAGDIPGLVGGGPVPSVRSVPSVPKAKTGGATTRAKETVAKEAVAKQEAADQEAAEQRAAERRTAQRRAAAERDVDRAAAEVAKAEEAVSRAEARLADARRVAERRQEALDQARTRLEALEDTAGG